MSEPLSNPVVHDVTTVPPPAESKKPRSFRKHFGTLSAIALGAVVLTDTVWRRLKRDKNATTLPDVETPRSTDIP